MPPGPPAPAPRPGPILLPAPEVYTVVREAGFSPLGIPHRRGTLYTIAVVDRRGEDGRLVINARDGRIVRFTPAYRIGEIFDEIPRVVYGSAGPMPEVQFRGPPRPPASVPRLASRTTSVPLPKARAGEPQQPSAGPVSQPPQQSAAVQGKPADAVPAAPPPAAAPAPVEATPAAPPDQPSQEMPKVQGLE
jgi:hypothetical protein